MIIEVTQINASFVASGGGYSGEESPSIQEAIDSLSARLKLEASQLQAQATALLDGVTNQIVFVWERKPWP